MPLLWNIILAAAAGVILGVAYFGTLWWTVRRVSQARHPAAWLVGSFLVRMVLLLGGVVLVCGLRWKLLVGCVAGILVARLVAVRWFGGAQDGIMKETSTG